MISASIELQGRLVLVQNLAIETENIRVVEVVADAAAVRVPTIIDRNDEDRGHLRRHRRRRENTKRSVIRININSFVRSFSSFPYLFIK